METNHETVLLLSDLDDFYIQFNNFVAKQVRPTWKIM